MKTNGSAEIFADVRTRLSFLARREGMACLLEQILRYPEIRRAFAASAGEKNPFQATARYLDLEIRMDGLAGQVPREGPVVVVANHGFGGADALALMASMCDLRDDFRVLANREVTLLDGVAGHVFPVNLLDPEKRDGNPASLRATLKHVRRGGALGVFPAGRVAYWQGDRMKDPPWNDHVVKLLQRMDATIVPLWFYGSPPAWIKILSRLSGLARTALIPTGLAAMRGRMISARAGEAFSSTILRELADDAGGWLRRHLEFLAREGN